MWWNPPVDVCKASLAEEIIHLVFLGDCGEFLHSLSFSPTHTHTLSLSLQPPPPLPLHQLTERDDPRAASAASGAAAIFPVLDSSPSGCQKAATVENPAKSNKVLVNRFPPNPAVPTMPSPPAVSPSESPICCVETIDTTICSYPTQKSYSRTLSSPFARATEQG